MDSAKYLGGVARYGKHVGQQRGMGFTEDPDSLRYAHRAGMQAAAAQVAGQSNFGRRQMEHGPPLVSNEQFEATFNSAAEERAAHFTPEVVARHSEYMRKQAKPGGSYG